MNTIELLKRYRDLLLSDRVAAEKFRLQQDDPQFLQLMQIYAQVGPWSIKAAEARKESIQSALTETTDIKPILLDSITEDIVAEVLEKTQKAQRKLSQKMK